MPQPRLRRTKLHAPGGVIAVVDDGGNLMALERLDGTFSAGANISIGKAKTAVMFKKPTRFFEELINSNGKGRTVMTAWRTSRLSSEAFRSWLMTRLSVEWGERRRQRRPG